jgi:hypothetical protein
MGYPMAHRFHVHQLVRLRVLLLDKSRNGIHQIVRLLPLAMDGTPLYRIKSSTEGTERVVTEDEIAPASY